MTSLLIKFKTGLSTLLFYGVRPINDATVLFYWLYHSFVL